MRSLARYRSDDSLGLLAIQCPTPVFTTPTHNAFVRTVLWIGRSGRQAGSRTDESTDYSGHKAHRTCSRSLKITNSHAAAHCAAIMQAAAARPPCGSNELVGPSQNS